MAGGPAVIPAFVAYLECQSLASGVNLAITTLIMLTIAFRSNALASLSFVSKMPLLSAAVFFLMCAYHYFPDPMTGTEASIRRLLVVSWCLDVVGRSLLLWFTSARLRAVSVQNNPWILRVTITLQLLQICGVSLAIYASAEPSVAFMSKRYKDLVTFYPALDLGTTALDVMVLLRLWSLRRQVIKSNANFLNVRAYWRAVACVLVMIALPVTSMVLVYLQLDPTAALYVLLLSFRVLYTDLFSAALTDSLLEKFTIRAAASASSQVSRA
ncbi:hypothetical protein HK105_208709 [Polyrhizophydium stewartii]|uniref:Uncharacterized protein n=1 Tax=Polyrhizophydium stewartii TaxID=2732419 RepID=A0ABR4MX35_9FUNG